jgi:hypothetical protein
MYLVHHLGLGLRERTALALPGSTGGNHAPLLQGQGGAWFDPFRTRFHRRKNTKGVGFEGVVDVIVIDKITPANHCADDRLGGRAGL